MPKTRQQKEQIVDQLGEKIKKAKSTMIVNFEGLTVADLDDLRQKCKEQGVEIAATKKTLLKLALEKENLKDVDVKSLTGSLALVFGAEDEVAPAKIVKNFAKNHEQISFQGGILEGKLISIETVRELANLPSKLELLAQVVGSIKAPISGLVNVLVGNLRGLVNVLNAIKDTKNYLI